MHRGKIQQKKPTKKKPVRQNGWPGRACWLPPVKFWVRIAVIVNKTMASDPDVHLLVMTELKRLDWEVTDLTSPVRVSKCLQPRVSCLSGQLIEIKCFQPQKRPHVLPSRTGWSAVVSRFSEQKPNFLHCKPCQRNGEHAEEPDTPPVTTLVRLFCKHAPKTIHLSGSARMWRKSWFMMQSFLWDWHNHKRRQMMTDIEL